MGRRFVALASALALTLAMPFARADDLAPRLIITAPRTPAPDFTLPVASDTLAGADIRDGRAQVNLSESLGGIPGLVVQNRQNYAQDLQISSRGFGARASFGVRGIRLYSDGIPATMPDGQGQVAHVDLGSAGSIEVLRGPFSVLYGNAAGGVIAVNSEDGRAGHHLEGAFSLGSFASRRAALKASGDDGALNYLLSASRFRTDGYRDHSAAERETANAKLRFDLGEADRASTLTLVANTLDMPASQDPMGLTRAQWRAEPRQASPAAVQFDARKRNDQQQLGLTWEHALSSRDSLRLATWGGQRDVRQFQAIPVVVQGDPRHPGGVIDLARQYGGVDVRWSHTTDSVETALGLSHEAMNEHRRGYQNFVGSQLGVLGELRRDEHNSTASNDLYAQWRWQFAPDWLMLAGVRHSAVRVESNDDYIVGLNGDDSGTVNYRATTPAFGLSYAVSPALTFYAAWGKGFETPTANELAYRSGDAAGLNDSLAPARSRHAELGLKARTSEHGRLSLARFDIATRDEIGQLYSSGGRAVFGNVGRTQRTGWELGWAGRWDDAPENGWARNLSAQLAYTRLDATYRDANLSSGALPGHQLPGVPASNVYGELAWTHPPSGFSASIEARTMARLWANDANTAAAPDYAVANLRLGVEQRQGDVRWHAFVRIDNLTDRRYVGSVIVNESQGRYYEPSPGRTGWLGLSASVAWR